LLLIFFGVNGILGDEKRRCLCDVSVRERIRTGRGEKRSKKSWDKLEIGETVERKENWMNLDGDIILWSI